MIFLLTFMKGEYMKDMKDINILVVGDIMLDRYIVGEVERISPEAPVPIVNVTDEYYTLGGCGNVVRNIAELGVNVDCLASIGKDIDGWVIEGELEEIGVKSLLFHGSKMTTVKERIIADHRKTQMIRVDRERTNPIDAKKPIDILKEKCHDNYDMIIVSDYAKGLITHGLMSYLKGESTKIIVDPKPEHGAMYDDVFMITPNEKEWTHMLTSSAYNLRGVEYILHTKGQNGMELNENQKNESWTIDAEPVPVYNVSGAGDVVVAMMAVCISKGINVLDSAYIANKCAGYAVTQPQTCVVPNDVFMKIQSEYFDGR